MLLGIAKKLPIKYMKTRINRILISCCLFVVAINAFASFPHPKNVHIELHYNTSSTTNVVGTSRKMAIMPYTYFYLNDLYSNDEVKVGSEYYKDGVASLDFNLSHPLYDELIPGGHNKIPFYVEPGDTLYINVSKNGLVESYERKGGKKVKFENLLLHDISNQSFYTEKEFNEDKQDARFPQFVKRVMSRMNVVVDSINHIADTYKFSQEERRLAVNNAKLQFALWLFEFAPFKSMELNNYSDSHIGGWQSRPSQENDIADIQNIDNYAFIRQLPLNDSTCLASRYFPRFMTSYEHTYFLNYDQYLYYGTSSLAQARMDSAFIAKDMKLTGSLRPSLFMDVAMQRKHFQSPDIDDGSIKLQEVQVLGVQGNYYKGVTTEDMVSWRQNQKPTLVEQITSPSYWISGRKKYKNRERAKALIKKIEEEEAADQAERDAVMKAYEEEMKQKESLLK